MNIEKVNPNIKYLYHYTLKKNVSKILKDQAIISKDQYVFFTKSLKDSIIAFEREMMQEGKLYVDINGVLRKREKCDKNDYCILKIPYKDDNQFLRFNFENQSKESIYTISISHKGAYQFKKAKVLDFPKNDKNNVLTKTAITAIAAGIMLLPYNVYAASWLDTNNFDTSWYTNASNTSYTINTAEGMAGLAYLVNNQKVTFDGKTINIIGNIDLTSNTWQTIDSIFKGDICGIHRIILNSIDGRLLENKDLSTVEYSYNVIVDDTKLKKINVKSPYTVKKLKETFGNKTTVFFDNEILSDDKSLLELNLANNHKIEVFSRYNLVRNIITGVEIPFAVESGDSIDNVKEKYSNKTNIPIDKIILKYKGKEVADGRTLADYNIQKCEALDAYIKIDINTGVDAGKGSIKSSQDTAISGEKIVIKLEPEKEYEIDKVLVNGLNQTGNIKNSELQIKCENEDINVIVTYKIKNKIIDDSKDYTKTGDDSKTKENTETKEDIKKNTDTKKDLEQDIKLENNIKTNNPKTGDNIFVYITTLITSILGICLTKIKIKK